MRFVSHRKDLDQDVERCFRRAVQETVGQAKDNAPVGRTGGSGINVGNVHGGLRGSITDRDVRIQKDTMQAYVGSSARHAAQREFGGPIVPVRAKMLAWRDPATGKMVFAKRVMQSPGGASNGRRPWLRPAGERFPEFMGDHLRRGQFGTAL